MFIGIENLYKKEGNFNKILKKCTVLYLIVVLSIIILSAIFFKSFSYKSLIYLPLLFIFLYLLIFYIITINLKLKFTFNLKENKKRILEKLENKNWLIDNDCYNIESVKIYM